MDFKSFHEVRYEFETYCCRLAAERRKPEHLKKMKAECEIQKDPTTNHEEFCHSDVRFHRVPKKPNRTLILRASAHWLWVAGKGPL
ncbi:MAG: FCD domain-containing protein [bacterium]